jgi:hypothetical protein
MAISRLPEQVDYTDTGCDLQPRCLRCALPMCRYDDWTATTEYRYQQVRQALTDAPGSSLTAVAEDLGMSVRTAYRAIQNVPGYRWVP